VPGERIEQRPRLRAEQPPADATLVIRGGRDTPTSCEATHSEPRAPGPSTGSRCWESRSSPSSTYRSMTSSSAGSPPSARSTCPQSRQLRTRHRTAHDLATAGRPIEDRRATSGPSTKVISGQQRVVRSTRVARSATLTGHMLYAFQAGHAGSIPVARSTQKDAGQRPLVSARHDIATASPAGLVPHAGGRLLPQLAALSGRMPSSAAPSRSFSISRS
jgi:hypothetical protein